MAAQHTTQRSAPSNGRTTTAGTRQTGAGSGTGVGVQNVPTEVLARLLGVFSIALGIVQILAPRHLARMIGVKHNAERIALIRAIGLRELAAGIPILMGSKPKAPIAARVAGDAMDIALLTSALNDDDSDSGRVAFALTSVIGVTALDLLCAAQLYMDSGDEEKGVHVVKSITINRPMDEVYGFWRNFQNLPRFMSHLESVEITGAGRSHWKAKAPAGMTVEWDAEMVQDEPNTLIAWRSLPGADVENHGSVQFTPAPAGRGTEIRVELQYNPPAGKLGAAVAKLFGEEPKLQIADDLRALKQVLETGEVAQADGGIPGKRLAMLPAQPHPQQAKR